MMHRGHVRPPSRDIPPAATCCEAKFTPEIWDLGGSSVIESNPLRALLSFDFFVAFGLPCAHVPLRLYAQKGRPCSQNRHPNWSRAGRWFRQEPPAFVLFFPSSRPTP